MRFYTPKRRQPSVIIVSLIDILTILLIFFVVTTTFRMPQPQVVINLPESKSAAEAAAPERPLIVYITSDERVFLDDQPVSVEELGGAIKSAQTASPDRTVAMRADRAAPFGAILRIIDALKAAGVRNLPAFTQTPE